VAVAGLDENVHLNKTYWQNKQTVKTRWGKHLSTGSSASQGWFPTCPKSDDARHAQSEKASGGKCQPFWQSWRMKDCPALFAGISPIACPNCVAQPEKWQKRHNVCVTIFLYKKLADM
jgi:hypothetical protein